MLSSDRWKLCLVFIGLAITGLSADADCSYGSTSVKSGPNLIDKNEDLFYIAGFKNNKFDVNGAKFFLTHKNQEDTSGDVLKLDGVFDGMLVKPTDGRLFSTADKNKYITWFAVEKDGLNLFLAHIEFLPRDNDKFRIKRNVVRAVDRNKSVRFANTFGRSHFVEPYLVNLKPCIIIDVTDFDHPKHISFKAEQCTDEELRGLNNTDLFGINLDDIKRKFKAVDEYPVHYPDADGENYKFSFKQKDKLGVPVAQSGSCLWTLEAITPKNPAEGNGAFDGVVTFFLEGDEDRCLRSENKFHVQLQSPAIMNGTFCDEDQRWSFFTKPQAPPESNQTADSIETGGMKECDMDSMQEFFNTAKSLIIGVIVAVISTIVATILFVVGMVGRIRYMRHKKEKLEKLGSQAYSTATEATTIGSTMSQASQASQVSQTK
ncbi:unnamed protein product [Bursaphelenchus okinawaensis]|uniref:Uncharacterized protein n=1 Tax=Bursaphelenchus okinawaensis TaxID=465554 RepID=A0A811KG76_9BILA|nr:unnamed protein product [Bursaphelenchus okinawaensis]CAG9102823.1 unnamed protein product [Bursaphelenchus okinawaensis]